MPRGCGVARAVARRRDMPRITRAVYLGAKVSQHRRRNRTTFFGQENWFPIVLVAICVFELNETKSRTAAPGSIGEIVNQLRQHSPMNLEPISILDRLVTFVQGDE